MSENLPLPSLADLLRKPENFAEHSATHWRIFNSMTGELVVEVPKNPPLVVEGGTQILAYNPAIIDMMCSKIMEGSSLTKLCELPGFPSYSQLCKWRRTEPWINEALELARRDRSERMRDLALESALQATDKNDAPAAALKSETYKWLAGVDDLKYKQNAKVDVAISNPTQIIVMTGIDRTPIDVTPEEKK